MLDLINIKDNESNKQYRTSCIYGIYLNDELVYLGKTTNAIQRWEIHKHHIIKSEDDCRKYLGDYYKLYVELRKAYNNGDKITFDIIEEVDKNLLSIKEREYLNKNKPILNIKDY